MGIWMLRAAFAAGGIVLGGAALAPAVSAEPCAVVVNCAEPEPEPEPEPEAAPSTTPTTTAPQMSSSEAAARLLSLLNGERAAAGLTPFTMRADVTEIAAGWTTTMAERSHLAHNDAYFTKETRRRLDAVLLGENVAYDGSVDAAHKALMASPPHRANILDGRFTVIGVAAQLHGSTWWVTQNFLQPASAAAPATAAPAPAPAAPTTSAPAPTATSAPSSATPTPDEPAAATPATDASGEVLSASSGNPTTAAFEPTERGAVVMSMAPTGMSTARMTQLLVAAVALLAAYALSWASASAKIRCRWSPRRTSRA